MIESATSAKKEATCPSTVRDGDATETPSVKNRLLLCYDFWERTICAPFYVLSIIKNGYAIPFVANPPPCYAKNNQSSLRHRDFVDSEIMNCLKKSYIQEVFEIPYCCNPLTVAEGKKLRLVLDLRHVNPYVRKRKHRYEDLDVVTDILNANDFFTMFDLVSAYYHINIHPDFFKYLGFEWTFRDGTTRYFVYTVLVFGLTSAGYIFTKVLRPLITDWRLKGFRVLFYLDDGFNIADSEKSCKSSTETISKTLTAAGFLINIEKSQLEPRQSGEWLGFHIDTRTMLYTVPQKKIEKLKTRLNEVMESNTASARLLSNITGTLSSMKRALGPLVALMTRRAYTDIKLLPDYDSVFPISQECRIELSFWDQNINAKNGYSIKPHHPTSQIIFTDASDHSYGGYILQRLGNVICQSRFNDDERGTSSTNRELAAIKRCLQSFANHLRHEAVEIRTDNQNAVRIIQKGSKKSHLQQLAVEIYELCTQNDILLEPTWIPRELNQYADYLSKLKDTDDWSIDNETFEFICRELGQPSFDRFADNLNRKVRRFNSRYWCPDSDGVNAFSHNWAHASLNWLCPPVKLIPATLRHARMCNAKGILVIPQWPSSYFWTLFHNGKSFEPFIRDYRIVDPYYTSTAEQSIFKGFADFHAIAFLIDFS